MASACGSQEAIKHDTYQLQNEHINERASRRGQRNPRVNGYLQTSKKGIESKIFMLHIKLVNVLQDKKKIIPLDVSCLLDKNPQISM